MRAQLTRGVTSSHPLHCCAYELQLFEEGRVHVRTLLTKPNESLPQNIKVQIN